MTSRFLSDDIETWRREGAVAIRNFFTPQEISAVQADFRTVFARSQGADMALNSKEPGQVGRFDKAQFKYFEAIPFDCSPALNLIGVHPALVAFAKAALKADHVHLYQCQAWAKFTGEADYDQPFHCDFANHTLTAPSEDATRNAVTFFIYFSDVSEAHGPMHYVTRSDSAAIAGPEETLAPQSRLQQELATVARSSAAPVGTAIAYGIDIYHRGTNMTAPGGHRYVVTACFKRAGDDSIGYHAWAFHHMKPWARVFEHASPEQLACFGVQLPGDPFWTEATLRRAQVRYPKWDMSPYRAAMR